MNHCVFLIMGKAGFILSAAVVQGPAIVRVGFLSRVLFKGFYLRAAARLHCSLKGEGFGETRVRGL